jgi:uncharacterized protein YjaZ
MKVHCLYRDFFVFLRMVNLESDPWASFRRYYFDKHRGFLSHIWFQYQGYTQRNIRERVGMLKKEDYAQVESALKLFDVEEHTREVIQHCKSLLHNPDPCHVYLFLGFFSPDGFVTEYENRWVICVGLERFRSFKNYDILVSHEYCHYLLNKTGGRAADALLHRLIREGIAVCFSRLAYPGRKESAYIFQNEERFRALAERFDDIMGRAGRGEIGVEELFGSHTETIPARSGYYLGYRLVRDFIEGRGIDDVQTLLNEERRILREL